jgi:hypothetical protein
VSAPKRAACENAFTDSVNGRAERENAFSASEITFSGSEIAFTDSVNARAGGENAFSTSEIVFTASVNGRPDHEIAFSLSARARAGAENAFTASDREGPLRLPINAGASLALRSTRNAFTK